MDMADDLTKKNTIAPVTQEFDESKGVAGRTNAILQTDSPLMQTAATQGAQSAAKRGLLNSSVGVQAGQQAVVNSAVPIATADASLYQQGSLANLAAKNSAATSNAQIGAQLGGQAMTLGSQERQTADTLAQRASEQSQQAQQFGVTSGQGQQQIDAQKAQFAQQLGMTAKELDLRVQQLGQAQQQIDAQKEQFAAQLGMTGKDLDLRRDQLTAQQQQFVDSLNVQKQQLTQQQAQFDTSLASNNANFSKELGQKQAQFDAAQVQQTVLAKADNETRLQLAQLDKDSRADIAGSQNISNAWGTMMQNIANVQNNANLDEAAKRTLVQNNIGAFQSFTNFWKKTGGSDADISDLLNFNIAAAPAPAPPPAPWQAGYYLPSPSQGPGGVQDAGNGA